LRLNAFPSFNVTLFATSFGWAAAKKGTININKINSVFI
jgi:hypothetical protein